MSVFRFAIPIACVGRSQSGSEYTFVEITDPPPVLVITIEGENVKEATRTLESRLSYLAQGHVLTDGRMRRF